MIELGNGVLYVGNALEELKKIPDNSVDCVITSPPYYMLRQYGKNGETECVWGGDPECEHEWGEEEVVEVRGDFSKANVANNRKGLDPQYKNLGSFCLKCGAWKGELGHEPDPDLFVSHLADVFDEVYRILKPTGNLFLNMGDTYVHGTAKDDFGKVNHARESIPDYGKRGAIFSELMKKKNWIKRKQLLLIPYRLAIELQMRGWIVRDLIIWAKSVSVVGKSGEIVEQFGNGLPESTRDRLTKSYEVIIHAVKSEKYFFNKPKTSAKPERIAHYFRTDESGACLPSRGAWEKIKPVLGLGEYGDYIKEEYKSVIPEMDGTSYGRNVIQVNTEPFPEAHFAVMPSKLVRFLMRTGCPEKICPECGKPYEVVEEVVGEKDTEEIRRKYGMDRNGNYNGQGKSGDTNPSELKRRLIESVKKVRRKTLKPFCNCGISPVPGTVLDPFMGAGTVALVAEELGKKWIGVEINPEYVEIIRRRLKNVQKVFF